jgi:pimeloyl-ACP methyl ester carboxylesterase
VSIQEKALRYGEGGRGFAMLTLPDSLDGAPVVVMLNAGLLHRTEPYRLNVLAARRLAALGYVCVRVDLSGKGETPAREALTNRESVALDWTHLCDALERHLGKRPFIVMGLCSGADNGIKLAAKDARIRGLILMDAESPPDTGFAARRWISRATSWRRWAHLPSWILRRLKARAKSGEKQADLRLRDPPWPADLDMCIKNMVASDGRILMVFTNHQSDRYNQQGQFCRAMKVPGLERICAEHYWPEVSHMYPVENHRFRLLALLEVWARDQLSHFGSGGKSV